MSKEIIKHLFSISATDLILQDDHNQAVMNDLFNSFININKIRMSTYRAGCAITELIIHYDNDNTFLLTIWEGELNVPPLSSDDIRLAHNA